MTYFLYLLRCADNSLYCGITNNITKRLELHQKGKGSKYVRSRLPFKLVFWRPFPDLSWSLKFEAKFKNLTKNEKENLISSSFMKKMDFEYLIQLRKKYLGKLFLINESSPQIVLLLGIDINKTNSFERYNILIKVLTKKGIEQWFYNSNELFWLEII